MKRRRSHPSCCEQAACLLFSDKAEVPPIFRSLSMAFEGQMQFGFAPPAMMAQA